MYYSIIKEQALETEKRKEFYQKAIKLYIGEHDEVFRINRFEYFDDPKNQYLSYNFLKLLTTSLINLMWSEKPEIKFTNVENEKYFFNVFVPESDFFNKMRRISETASFAGDALAHLGVEENMVTLSLPENGMWIPIFDKSNVDKREQGHILIVAEKWTDEKQQQKAFLLQIEKNGQIEYEAYRQNKDQVEIVDVNLDWRDKFVDVLGERDPIEPRRFIYKTNCKYPLLFRFPNYRISGRYFGVSDYSQSVISKVFNINQILNQIAYVLKGHMNPKMIVPKDLIKQAIRQISSGDDYARDFGFENSSSALAKYSGDKSLFETQIASKILKKQEFIGSDINTGEIKYMTWDGNLNESREMIKLLTQSLFEETQLSKVLIDPDVSIGQASGVAILRLAQPTFHERAKKIDYLQVVMQKLIYTVLELAKDQKIAAVEPEYPTIIFKDGLVDDMNEIILQTQQMLENDLMSQIDAIARVQKISRESAESKKSEIDAEKETQRQQFINDGINQE